MAHPAVIEIATKHFEVIRSGAFIALFTQTLGNSGSTSFVIGQSHTVFLPGLMLTLLGHEPINLLHVPSDIGQTAGDYLITVSLVRVADDRVELTCTITNTAPHARTDSWEMRGTRDDVIVWELDFRDKTDRTVVDCVVSDPCAELTAPISGSELSPVVITAVDPRGTPGEPTFVGTLPADLEPRISWMHVGDIAIAGMPDCTCTDELAVVLPAVGQPTPVTLVIRTTFGGACPLNRAYLESESEPVTMTVTPRS